MDFAVHLFLLAQDKLPVLEVFVLPCFPKLDYSFAFWGLFLSSACGFELEQRFFGFVLPFKVNSNAKDKNGWKF